MANLALGIPSTPSKARIKGRPPLLSRIYVNSGEPNSNPYTCLWDKHFNHRAVYPAPMIMRSVFMQPRLEQRANNSSIFFLREILLTKIAWLKDGRADMSCRLSGRGAATLSRKEPGTEMGSQTQTSQEEGDKGLKATQLLIGQSFQKECWLDWRLFLTMKAGPGHPLRTSLL